MRDKFLIGFKKKENTLRDKAMSLVLRSEFVHCELIFTDGKVGSANQYVGVQLFEDTEKRNSALWEFYEIPHYYEAETRKYVEKKIGKKYNWAGIWGSMLVPVGISQDGFCCSDLAYVALLKAGVPIPDFDPEGVSPGDLRLMVSAIYPKYLP